MSASAPRTKPWEVSSGTSAASTQQQPTAAPSSLTNPASAAGTTTSAAANPHIPDRPTSLTSEFNNVAEASPYGTSNAYGTGTTANSAYGTRGMSGYGSGMYGSGYGSSMYGGGYGGYGSGMYGGGYGGYGSGMYGSGMYGSGMYNNQANMGMMQGGFGESTQATFHLIESIIGAVGGFAQMLEATYMATHSSFFTMVNLAEQFGNLKNALGSLLGIFALIKFVKKIFAKLTGSDYNHGLNAGEFAKFEKKQHKALQESIKKSKNSSQQGKSRISLKPLLLFLAASIGFPYLLSKAIQMLNEQNKRKQMEMQQQQQQQLQSQNGGAPVDLQNLQFAKALYEFNPENPQIEIEMKPNELVAILSKLDPMGQESKWWKVRSRSGQVGYVPSNYLAVIERKPQQQRLQAPPSPSPTPATSAAPQLKHAQTSPGNVYQPSSKEWDGKPDELLQEFRKFNN
ncbi:uncharacterized protein LODBEIA_P19360 [Lodderomyces beijingensis]|uniref:Peroxisomal membrane protein PEX13 n=1 Tax=Lodderomyces beijingensis TaxID=1775926 RepID=A0ABP0ZNF0_9ASCO